MLYQAKTKEFYFIRHGQTDHNAGIIAECLDLPLNEYGRNQANAIEPLIAQLPVKTVCHSPLLRARETKNIIAAQLKVQEHEITDLAECSLEDWRAITVLKTGGHLQASHSLQLFVTQVNNGI